ncbi:alpha-amylase family glycosyl hydrolase [Brachybacterium sacelli]|uniref:Glycosidase n=1 Tax=Brachybacterium sacelli TaxID=173364 RepID=A0ABS4WXX9_9MICO|nr:alpha-amylase family glycosyl hydrolase [Brachybacterium sacelli]MBP2381043.1 glycosidase [Brachybacterium sacelli]
MNTTEPSSPPWIRDAICWQVYPLGFCGAPGHREDLEGEGYGGAAGENVVHRLPRLLGWLDHLVGLGANVMILNPVFDSVSHGYDTLDHRRPDPRLGSDQDVDALIAACHERGIRVVLDGVFNHVSDRHPVARRAISVGPNSPEGAHIRWAGEHPYAFEGNADLVELDLSDSVVQDAIVDIMTLWLDRGADGWRLDAMYAAGAETWAPILERVRTAHPQAWLLGEVIHGDYSAFAAASGADSVTQYELWKAIWSALHDENLFELAHALGRHQEFLDTDGGSRPLTFVGNHDTTRIASQLSDGRDLAVAYALLALLPGIPAVYAGDEFGAIGVKEERPGGDDAIRPAFPEAPAGVREGPEGTAEEPAATDDAADPGSSPAPRPLQVLDPEAAPRILEVHQRLLALRRREAWLAEAHVEVREGTLENAYAEIVLTPRDEAGTRPLTLVLNLGEEDRPAPGEVLEAVSGADMLDAAGPAAAGAVPAHGVAVVR